MTIYIDNGNAVAAAGYCLMAHLGVTEAWIRFCKGDDILNTHKFFHDFCDLLQIPPNNGLQTYKKMKVCVRKMTVGNSNINRQKHKTALQKSHLKI